MREFFVLLLFVCCVGCGQLTDSGPSNPVSPQAKENCWEYVARLVERGKISDTDLLIKTVENLRAEDAILDSDQDDFFKAFQGIRERQRPIDAKADAALLRGL